jgi:prepilin-type N-terminal cleavage/methylation domain-containing protein
MHRNARKHTGFSLVELVIVIVIIGVIAAIAVPRISRGAKGAADAALKGNLTALRNAIDLYAAEHGGDFPTVAKFVEQLTTYTDTAGADNATKDAASGKIYGPYIKSIPGLPVKGTGTTGGAKGDKTVAASDAAAVGWLYNATSGAITANTGTAKDEADVLYTAY